MAASYNFLAHIVFRIRKGLLGLVINGDASQQPSTDPDSILSIDLGTSSCKCAVVGLDGKVIAWDAAKVSTQIIGHDGAEQEPADWWRSFCQAARGVVRIAYERSKKIVAVCASTQSDRESCS